MLGKNTHQFPNNLLTPYCANQIKSNFSYPRNISQFGVRARETNGQSRSWNNSEPPYRYSFFGFIQEVPSGTSQSKDIRFCVA